MEKTIKKKNYSIYTRKFLLIINIIKILPALKKSFYWLLIVVELLNHYSFFILTIK